jgi:hypothetical protein
LGADVFFENVDTFVLEDVVNLTFGIEDVAKDASACRANFHTSGVFPGTGALEAEGAFLNDAFGTRAIAEVTLVRVDGFVGDLWFFVIEAASIVGAGGHTVAATDTPVVINDDYTIVILPGSFDGTGFGARRLPTLVALNGHVVFIFLRNFFRVVVVVGGFEINGSFGQLQDADVGHVNIIRRVTMLVVLGHAGMGAFTTSNTAREVKRVGKTDSFGRLQVSDTGKNAVSFLTFFFQFPQDGLHPFWRKFFVMFLKQTIEGDFSPFEFEQWLQGDNEPAHPDDRCGSSLKKASPIHGFDGFFEGLGLNRSPWSVAHCINVLHPKMGFPWHVWGKWEAKEVLWL